MSAVLKIVFACIVGGAWYHLNGPDQGPVALIICIMVLFAAFMKPVKYQDPKERELYRSKIQEARERRRLINEKQQEEKKKLKKQALEEEEMRKQELRKKLKI